MLPNIVESVGSLFESNKTKTENEQLKQRISELESQAEEREQYIKKEHKTEQSKLTECLDKARRYFPYVEKLLPLIDYCRNTIYFSDAIISELCRFKKVPFKGNFYSSEFNRKFQAENATFPFGKDNSKKGNFQI